MRAGDARHAAVAQGRRVPQPRGARRYTGERRAPPAPDGDRGDRQPRERRRRPGDSEYECDARIAGNRGAAMLNVRVVKIGGNELDRPAWGAGCARALKQSRGFSVVGPGGGPAGSARARRPGPPVDPRDGLRVTTPEI